MLKTVQSKMLKMKFFDELKYFTYITKTNLVIVKLLLLDNNIQKHAKSYKKLNFCQEHIKFLNCN